MLKDRGNGTAGNRRASMEREQRNEAYHERSFAGNAISSRRERWECKSHAGDRVAV